MNEPHRSNMHDDSLRMGDGRCRWHRATIPHRGITIFVRGGAFLDETFYADEALAQQIADAMKLEGGAARFGAIKEIIPKLNGAWALVVRAEDGETLAAVDRLRSIPLFYAWQGNATKPASRFCVAPEADALRDCSKATVIDETAARDMLLAGFVIGDRTLFEGVGELRPGEILHRMPDCISDATLVRTRYYRYLPERYSDANDEQLLEELDAVMHRVFSRLVRALDGRRVIAPLSGGLDSRLLVTLLKQHGHDNLLAVSYGREENQELLIGRQVAAALGVAWEPQVYAEGDWYRLMTSERMHAFLRYGGQASSLACFQDFLAIERLRAKEGDSDTMVLAGISGDMIAGAWTPAHFVEPAGCLNLPDVVREIHERKVSFWSTSRSVQRHVRRQLLAYFDDVPLTGFHNSAAAFDLWEFENRQPRFIVNSVRTYEFLGYGWWNGFCDNELMDFFLTVPTRLREAKRLYSRWARERCFTGHCAKLAEIQILGDARYEWCGLQRPRRRGPRCVASNAMRRFLPESFFLKEKLRRWEKRGGTTLRLEEWFASTQAETARRTVGDLLNAPNRPLHGLPVSLRSIVARHSKYPLCLASSTGLLAAQTLASVWR